jgi:hypothetical protein
MTWTDRLNRSISAEQGAFVKGGMHFAWYNLVRIRRGLRVTPAMGVQLAEAVD